MNYGRMPLFPGGCAENSCLRVPLFGEAERWSSCGGQCQSVRFSNPVCPGEYADVELCLDSCGNLSICVRRPPGDCCRGYRRRRC